MVNYGVVPANNAEEVKKQKFDDHISVEHENHWKESVPHVKAAIDFVKANPK